MQPLNHFRCGSRTSQRAFTCVDLLVLIVICSVLGAMLLVSVLKSGSYAARIQCRNNIKQQLQAYAVYGSENNDQLPINSYGAWAWDMSAVVANQLLAAGATKWGFYDPGTRPKFGPAEWFDSKPALWTFGAPDPDPNPLQGQIRVIGYALTLRGTSSYFNNFLTNINSSFVATTTTLQSIPIPIGPPSARILTACATLNSSGQSDFPSVMALYNWTDIPGGYEISGRSKGHISAHMATTKLPEGGNVGMLDGHVEWRPFNQMICRVASSPFFYY